MSLRAHGLVVSLLIAATAVEAQEGVAPLGEPLRDPIPEDPKLSRLALVLEEYAAFPKSDPDPLPTDARLQRHARINYLGEIPDGSGRMYVPDLNGMLYLVVRGEVVPYLDLGRTFEPEFFASAGLGSGFGFVTFHPEFARNGKFYTVHTENDAALVDDVPDLTPQPNTAFHGIITEWIARDPGANRFDGSRRELLRLGFATRIHGIQQIAFNPTAGRGDEDYGLLYIAAGDGGIGFETEAPQDLSTPQGKLLRIDPAGNDSASGKYGIPRANPFVGRTGVLGEIYAYGLRDPHRFSWDSAGGHRMFLGHIGEKDIEMVYDVLPGDNFGWSKREGRFVYDNADRCHLYPLPADDARYGYVYPLAEFDHDRPPELACGADAGHAISGGFMYRGPIARLRGKYIFGDLVDGRVFYLEERDMRRDPARRATIYEMTVVDRSGEELAVPQLVGDARVDLRFGTDSRHNLYLLAKADGKIWRVTGAREISRSDAVFPSVAADLVAHYDFGHPARFSWSRELDQGLSGTHIDLLNDGARMRVWDPAYETARWALQVAQIDPQNLGNDDWKAGVFDEAGVGSLAPFNAVRGTTIMLWVNMSGDGPAPNTQTPEPDDRYNAMGLAGILTGNSDGHAVRALIELINVGDQLRLVALGRRLDEGRSQTFAADADWRTLLPRGEWVHLAATFNFSTGTMKLYRNGHPIAGTYTADDPWQLGTATDLATSPTHPRGLKIGGSFPQNSEEKNPGQCRMDDVMFLDRALTQIEVNQQYRRAIGAR
jgi:hypothetical protein